MATRDPGPPESRGTNTALVVVVVILIAALIGIFIWWGTDDDEVEIDLPNDDIGLVQAASAPVACVLPVEVGTPRA